MRLKRPSFLIPPNESPLQIPSKEKLSWPFLFASSQLWRFPACFLTASQVSSAFRRCWPSSCSGCSLASTESSKLNRRLCLFGTALLGRPHLHHVLRRVRHQMAGGQAGGGPRHPSFDAGGRADRRLHRAVLPLCDGLRLARGNADRLGPRVRPTQPRSFPFFVQKSWV